MQTLRSISLFVCAAVLLLSQIACEVVDNKEIVTVTEIHNKGDVSVVKGGLLTIRLKSQAGTGYQWEIVNHDEVQLASLGSDNESVGDQRPGGPQYQVFRFRAQNIGTSHISLHYQRAWEKENPPAKAYHITVHVTGNK